MSKTLWSQYSKVLYLFAAMAFCITAKAEIQKVILSGSVKSTDKSPVDFATVYLKDTNFGCTTDEKGEYSLNAPAGNYTLVVSAIGFETYEKSITIGSHNSKHRITLKPSVTELDEVVVVSNGVSLLKRSAFNAVAVDTREMKNRLTVACNKGTRRLMYDSHVALGFYATIFLLLMALTGPTWSFGWYREAAYTLLGAEPQTSNQQPGHAHGHTDKKESSNTERNQDYTIAYDVVLKEIQDIYTDYNYIKLSKNEATVLLNKYAYRQKSDNVKFNSKTGEIPSVRKFEDNSVRQNLRGLIYSLHVGTWGGPLTKVLYFIAALIGASLPLTGYYFWMKRKKMI